MKKHPLAFAILIFIFAPNISGSIGLAEANPPDAPAKVVAASADMSRLDRAQSIRDSIVFHETARPTEKFWNQLAQCETANNWQNGGQWAGGLGIYTKGDFRDANAGTWERFGGEEFAPSPDKATKEQQIIVANRIAFEGYTTVVHRDPKVAERMGVPATYVWDKKPSGLGGWGCYKSKHTGKFRMEKPRLFYSSTPKIIPQARFYMYETGKIVEDLQTYLRIKVDGVYGPATRKAHLSWLKKRGLSTDGVPQINVRNAGLHSSH